MTPMSREELRKKLEFLALSIGDGTYSDEQKLKELIDVAEIGYLDLIEREKAQARAEGASAALKFLHEKYDKVHEARSCTECDEWGFCAEKTMAFGLLQESLMLDGKLPMVHKEDRALTDHLITQYQDGDTR